MINLPEMRRPRAGQAVLLEPGDSVFVPEAGSFVQVLRPNSRGCLEVEVYRLQPDERVRDFLLRTLDRSDLEPGRLNLARIEVIHPGKRPRQVDFPRMVNRPSHRDNVALKPDDLVFVPGKKLLTDCDPYVFNPDRGPTAWWFYP